MPPRKASARQLICTGCGNKHPPPRGTKCKHMSTGKAPATPQCSQTPVRGTREHQASADTVEILSKLAELQTTQNTMATRVGRLEQPEAVEWDAESANVSQAPSRATSQGQSRSRARSQRHRSRGHGRRRKHRRSRSSSDSSSRSSSSESRSTRKRGLKSGLDHGPQRSVTVKVQWPTDVVFRGVSEQRIKFDDLTQNELTLGFVRLIQERADKEARRGSQPQVSRAMLNFLEQWTDDAGNYTWPTVLGYVKLVFLALERGKLSWTESAKLQDIRDRARAKGTTIGQSRAPQASARQSGQQTASQGASKKKRYCAAYNKGICPSNEQSHDSSQGIVHHICGFCLSKKGNSWPHPEVDCNQKSGSRPHTTNPSKN
jgi:hypothetical protein